MADACAKGDGARRIDPLVMIAGTLSVAIYAFGLQPDDGSAATDAVMWRYVPLFGLMLLAAWRVFGARTPSARHALWPILAFALIFRVLAVLEPPQLSSDVHRYPWDGRVQRAGVSPYSHPPAAPALLRLRDDVIWPRINRPNARTVYPPGAQVLFAALPYDIDAVRGVMIAADLLTILLLIVLLRRLGRDPARVLLYAWMPLVVYEVANNGHLEAAMLPLLIGAVLAVRTGRLGRGGALLGLATAMKLYPGLAVAALARRGGRSMIAVMAAVVALLYAAYALPVGAKVLGFLPRYVGAAEDHNIGLRAVIEAGLLPLVGGRARAVAVVVCAALIVAAAGFVARWSAPLERRLLVLTGLYLLALPTALHPWYALWMLPWLCFHPSAPWLWLAAALPLSYLKYGAAAGVMPGWVRPVEFGPPALMLAWQAVAARRAC